MSKLGTTKIVFMTPKEGGLVLEHSHKNHILEKMPYNLKDVIRNNAV